MPRKKKAPGKIVDFAGKHKLEEAGILSTEDIRELDSLFVDSVLSPLYDTMKKKRKKKNMDGAVMKKRGGTFKGTF